MKYQTQIHDTNMNTKSVIIKNPDLMVVLEEQSENSSSSFWDISLESFWNSGAAEQVMITDIDWIDSLWTSNVCAKHDGNP